VCIILRRRRRRGDERRRRRRCKEDGGMKKGGKAQLQKAKTSGTEQTNKQNREEDVGRGTRK